MPMMVYVALITIMFMNAGCHTAPPTLTDSSGEVLTFVARDHAFDGPDNIRAGHVTIRLVNEGHDPHAAQFIKLTPGKSAEDLIAAMKADPSVTPEWAHYAGGPNVIMANDTADAMLDLEAGEYVLICRVPDRRGTLHVAFDMMKPVRVIEGPRKRRVSPTDPTDSVIRAIDFRFNVQQPLRAGRQRVRLVNRGTQPHEAVFVQLTPGATLKDFIASLEPNASGPPPGRLIGGMALLEQDQEGSALVKLTPGRYGLLCFFPDPSTGLPHFAKGMATEFEVE